MAGATLIAGLLAGPGTQAAPAAAAPVEAGRNPADLFAALQYRMVGPYRGGRVTAVTGIPEEPFTFYMGSTGGGVWKSTNAGESWANVSDGFFDVGSVGAIAVAPSDINVVWVGTGSACPRGNVSTGKGVYRSTDAGRTWSHIGLEGAGQIGRIRVHPTDPDTAWVAVLGQIFGPNDERGVFRTRDGGKTWQKVLFVSAQAGAVDLALDPANPRRLFAAIWRVERKPWTLIDGGEESGLYRSLDGGDTWDRVEGGLPQGELGRIGVSISPANPQRVWALVSANEDRGGLFVSLDGGAKWERTSDNRELQTRGWYYTHVYADPVDEHTVWVNNVRFWKSIDGGRNFESVRVPHGDNHDIWINPRNPKILIQANDGGSNVSLDGALTWSSQHNQPTAEFYRVTTDNRFPYRLYGAQQDNSTISVPSWSLGGITPEQYWFDVAGAESGHIAVDPRDPNLIYSGNYLGQIDRYDRRTGNARNVIAYPQMQDGTAPRDLKYRFQWNAPILISRHDPDVVFHGSNFLLRTRDGGETWQRISPDLTRNDPEKQELPGGPVQHDHTGVEVYNTVFTIAESSFSDGEIWVGTDDGLVKRTLDGGASWVDVTPKGLPADATVNAIELSSFRRERAFVVAYRYRMNDWRPYAFRTDDGGKSWSTITKGIPEDQPVRVLREDGVREGLLFSGTEFGMFVSFDAGDSWQPFQLNLPHTPVTDLQVHGDELVVATQGRSFWILDGLPLLRQLGERVEGELRLFVPAAAVRVDGGRGFRGERSPENPDRGAVIRFWLSQAIAEAADKCADSKFSSLPDQECPKVEIEIRDGAGTLVRRFGTLPPEPIWERWQSVPTSELEITAGMNKLVWDLTYPAPNLVAGAVMSLAYTGGPAAPPGAYKVLLFAGGETKEQAFVVEKDPRLVDVSQSDLDEQFRFAVQVRDRLSGVHRSIRNLRSARDQVRNLLGLTRGVLADADQARLAEQGDALISAVDAWEEDIIQAKSKAGQDPINFPPRIDDQYAYLYSYTVQNYGRPTAGSFERWRDLEEQLGPLLVEYQRIAGELVPAFAGLTQELGVGGIIVPKVE